ncbi:transcriptional regulator, TetR family [Actinobacteria bacterium OK074]|nr:transcriptional regulator, TetR family [Actinobacteria bacterium OK074]
MTSVPHPHPPKAGPGSGTGPGSDAAEPGADVVEPGSSAVEPGSSAVEPGPAPAGPPAPAEQPPAPAERRGRGRPTRTQAAATPATRDLILAAAREEFSARGYDKTSVRGIAKAAGVDSALVHRYFGTKEQIFEAAITVAFAPVLTEPSAITDGPLDGVGERLARFVFGVWENPVTRTPLLAVVRSAVNNETAAAIMRRLVAAQLMRRIADRLDLPDPELRAELAAAQLVGAAVLRYVIKVEPLASADVEQIIARVAPVVQGHLTQP